MNKPALVVVSAFREKGWRLESLDHEGDDLYSIVAFRDEGRNLRLTVFLYNRQLVEKNTPHGYGRELYRRSTEHALGGWDDYRRSGSDGMPPAQYRYDFFDNGAQRWNVAGGQVVEDGENFTAETAHSAFAQHGVWVRTLLLASDRPEDVRAVTTDVANTLAPLTLDPA
jgi:hypothetical protein